MRKLPIVQVDAFTRTPYGGNPCAVLFDAAGLSEEAMQAIALEMNLSETAFVMDSATADVRARYFTPAAEIPLAGHPTVATIFALITEGRLPVQETPFTLQLELQAGVIPVEVAMPEPGLYLITMSQKRPRFFRSYDPVEVLPAFGLEESDALEGYPIMTVSTGTPGLMIPLASLDSLRRARLDAGLYAPLLESGDFFSPHLFVVEGVTERGSTFARNFGLPPDTYEDPFTGSATGSMAAYLWRHGLLERPTFIAEQGHWMGRPGEAFVEVIGGREAIETVKVGGHAVTIMRGEIAVPESDSGES